MFSAKIKANRDELGKTTQLPEGQSDENTGVEGGRVQGNMPVTVNRVQNIQAP